jgi:hypothetical protein
VHSEPMSIELTHLGRLTIEIDDHTRLPGSPSGDRLVGSATSYRFEGDRIRATARATPATDWVTVRAGGSGTVDARLLLETDDGAYILVRYEGRITYQSDGASVVIAPTFETNDERYAWLNSVQGIGKGERVGTTLIYEIYQAQ